MLKVCANKAPESDIHGEFIECMHRQQHQYTFKPNAHQNLLQKKCNYVVLCTIECRILQYLCDQ